MKDAVAVCIGLAMSHFLLVAMNEQTWDAAMDRIYFQVTGILTLLIIQQLNKVKK